MRGKRIAYLALAALLALTAVMALIHLQTRDKVPEGAVLVEHAETETVLILDDLHLVPVRGTVVNGKGEERAVEAEGVLLADVLSEAGIENAPAAAVTAKDEYSVRVTGEELAAPDRVYLIREPDGIRMVVFGDENSKRNVSGVAKVSVP